MFSQYRWAAGGVVFIGSEAIGVGDRLGEGVRGFLGQVVPDAAGDGPVLYLPVNLLT